MFSEQATNDREREEATFLYFFDFLDECQSRHSISCAIVCIIADHICYCTGGKLDVTLKDVMIFFSGSNEVPAVKFSPAPSLHFNKDNLYPTASTCSLELVLPSKYYSYKDFKKSMTTGLLCHGGFGKN